MSDVAAGPVIPNFGQGSACVTGDHTFCWDWVREPLGRHARARARAAHRADRDRGRDRVRDRLPARAARAPLRRLEQPIGVVSALLYTIPSLALFQLLIPFTGSRDDGRDRARRLHARDPVPEHRRRACDSAPDEVLEAARGMGLTRRQIADAGRAAARRAGDHRRPADRRRLDGLDRDDRRVPAARRARLPDLPRAQGADAVQDRDLLGRRARGRARAHLRRCCSSLLRRVLAPWAAKGSHDRSATPRTLHTFVDAIRFIGDHPGFLAARRRSSSSSSSGAALAIAIAGRPPARRRARPPPPRLGHRDRNVDRRPRAPEPRPDRGVPDPARDRLRQQHGRARGARAPARS